MTVVVHKYTHISDLPGIHVDKRKGEKGKAR